MTLSLATCCDFDYETKCGCHGARPGGARVFFKRNYVSPCGQPADYRCQRVSGCIPRFGAIPWPIISTLRRFDKLRHSSTEFVISDRHRTSSNLPVPSGPPPPAGHVTHRCQPHAGPPPPTLRGLFQRFLTLSCSLLLFFVCLLARSLVHRTPSLFDFESRGSKSELPTSLRSLEHQ